LRIEQFFHYFRPILLFSYYTFYAKKAIVDDSCQLGPMGSRVVAEQHDQVDFRGGKRIVHSESTWFFPFSANLLKTRNKQAASCAIRLSMDLYV
jgi:hypothetical protein